MIIDLKCYVSIIASLYFQCHFGVIIQKLEKKSNHPKKTPICHYAELLNLFGLWNIIQKKAIVLPTPQRYHICNPYPKSLYFSSPITTIFLHLYGIPLL